MVECALVCWSAACAASDGRRCPARIAVGRGVTGTKVTSRQVATPFASMTQGVPHWSGHPAGLVGKWIPAHDKVCEDLSPRDAVGWLVPGSYFYGVPRAALVITEELEVVWEEIFGFGEPDFQRGISPPPTLRGPAGSEYPENK